MSKPKESTNPCSKMEIPDYAIERLARCLLPMIRSYYDSEDGKKELLAWEKAKLTKITDKN